MSTQSQTFVKGAFFMALAGLISKFLGVIYAVPLYNMIGSYGMGLYQIAYPWYLTMLTIATAGFPLALSKAVAERVAVADYDGADRIFGLSLRLMTFTGITAFLILFFGAPLFAAMAGNSEASLAIRALSIAILVVPLLAAFRGYLQGHQNMGWSGTSQVIEQLVRVIVILSGTYLVLKAGYGVAYGAAAATFGGAVGAIASLLIVVYFAFKMRKQLQHKMTGQNRIDVWPILKKLVSYAIPISLAGLVLPIAQQVDTNTVVNLLKWSGVTREAATEAFGILTNDGYRLIQLPVSFATAIGYSLLPAVSEAIALKNQSLVHDRVTISFRLISLLILPSTAVMVVLAAPIDLMLFGHTNGARVIQIVSFMGIFMSFELITTFMLQGIGQMYLPVRNMLIGTGCKLILNLLFIPFLGITGAAISASLAYAVSSWLNVRSVFRLTGVRLEWALMLTRPLTASVLFGGFIWGSYALLHRFLSHMFASPRLLVTLELMIVLLVGGIFYVIVTLLIGSVSKTEISYIPKIGGRLARLLERWPRLIKS
ncbi:putative polysaccharide biosynthesis protein [Effusibacillus dendaii]|uniref:Stage V sporulation protein B n=1 Tax=Effusibacillus dendaii TaxID=2743772 RepID=A0A7I8DG43_9BACL|nr:polysaccharide biosynthesis protein [Effusibacillus dendaii]BCJ87836.1 stage V sporulation protein B [Effusibacillus dendaii]